VEIHIDRGDGEQNKQIFDILHEHKAEIETAFGKPLEWQRLDAKRACCGALLPQQADEEGRTDGRHGCARRPHNVRMMR
jgi:hypothetical protein